MKRIIFKNIYKNKKDNNKNKEKTICITGVTRKQGVTHTCLFIANFISSVLREKVLYIEYSKESSLLTLVGDKSISIGEVIGYQYKSVNYVLTDDVDVIRRLLSSKKGWIVLDLKALDDKSAVIFNQCNKKIVIGSFLPWQRRDYHEFIRKNIRRKHDINSVDFYQKNKDKEGEKAFGKIYGVKLKSLPVINNPFSLKEENFEEIINVLM